MLDGGARRSLAALCAFGGSLALCTADVTFGQSDWTDLSSDTTVALGPTAADNWTVNPTGGNPGSWVELSESVASGPVDVWVGLLTNSWVYNPSTQGGIDSIDFSADVDGISGPSKTAIQLLLEQAGNYYYSLGSYVPTGSWSNSGAVGLNASSFWQIDPVTGEVDYTSHPDFASGSAAISFGYALGVQTSSGASQGYDNIAIDVHNTVAEPDSLLPLGAGVGFVAFRRRATRSMPAKA